MEPPTNPGGFTALGPHLNRVYQLMRTLWFAQTQSSLSQAALDRLSCGVVHVDASLSVLSVNRAAIALTRQTNAAAAILDNRFLLLDRWFQDILEKRVQDLLSGQPVSPNLVLPGAAGKRPLTISLLLPGKPDQQPAVQIPARSVLICLGPVELDLRGRIAQLRSTFGFTPQEARLASLLLDAGTLPEVARGMGIAVSTARGYLNEIFRKTGVNNQVQLVKRLLSEPYIFFE